MKYSRISDLRVDNDLKQKVLANYLGVSDSAYGSYETGYRGIPSEVWSKLADYYGTSVDYLMGRTDEPRPYPRNHKK